MHDPGRERIGRNPAHEISYRQVCIRGNHLGRPLLGLPAEEFDLLAAEIDAIYHNGAVVNLVFP